MMARLLLIVFWLASFMVLALGASIALGRATPLPEEVAALHLGDMCELPCWIGITPGKTTVEEAEKRLQQVYKNLELVGRYATRPTFAVPSPNGMKMTIELDVLEGTQVVGDIRLYPANPKKVKLGTVMSVLGELPQLNMNRMSYVPLVNHTWYKLWTPVSVQEVNRFPGVITPQQPVETIQLYYRGFPTAFEYTGIYAPWRGFRIYSFEYLIFNEAD